MAAPSDIQSLIGLLGGPAAGTSPEISRSDRALMPSFNAQYAYGPQGMIYFTYARGFKAGGINGQDPLSTQNIQYGPEHVNSYELGIKSKWLENHLLVNLDVFRSDYKDLQVAAQIFIPALNAYRPLVRNAASSRSQGVELETRWQANRVVRLSSYLTYLDSKYVNWPNAGAGTLQSYCGSPGTDYAGTPQCHQFGLPVSSFQDLSGHPTDFAPRWSGSVDVSISLPIPGGYKFITDVSPYYTSGYFASNGTDDPLLYIHSSARLDARLSVESPDSHWAFDVIGKNLTDRVIGTSFLGIYNASRERPRNVVAQVRFRW